MGRLRGGVGGRSYLGIVVALELGLRRTRPLSQHKEDSGGGPEEKLFLLRPADRLLTWVDSRARRP